jgi:hypothetical protein
MCDFYFKNSQKNNINYFEFSNNLLIRTFLNKRAYARIYMLYIIAYNYPFSDTRFFTVYINRHPRRAKMWMELFAHMLRLYCRAFYYAPAKFYCTQLT